MTAALLLWGLSIRSLALVYLISFLSIQSQIIGLSGCRGLRPVRKLLDQIRRDYASDGTLLSRVKVAIRFPSLLWIFGSSDAVLFSIPWAGIVLAGCTIVGGFSQTVSGSLFACMHLLYLSLDIPVGLTYPWDSALLEIGWYAPLFPRVLSIVGAGGSLQLSAALVPIPAIAWLCRWQICRLMLGFGKQKFIGTSSSHHCYLRGFMVGMPMPSKLGWLMHHQPLWAHKLSLGIMFIVEILLPPLFLWGGIPGAVAALGTCCLMVGIQATGNFGYFNLLTAALCLPAFDTDWKWALPSLNSSDWGECILALLIVPYTIFTAGYFLFNSWCNQSWPFWPTIASLDGALGMIVNTVRKLSRYRFFSSYGVFPPNSNPPLRFVVVMEGSSDKKKWSEFNWKFMTSGDGASQAAAPRHVAPHHPRMDHSVFYAAFGLNNQNYLWSLTCWNPYMFQPSSKTTLEELASHILDGNALVQETFFSNNPFQSAPPAFVRASLFCYSPTSLSEWWQSGGKRWWKRMRVHEHMQPMSKESLKKSVLCVDGLPPPECFHVDATQTWKAEAGALRKHTNASSREADSSIIASSGSPPASCWGLSVGTTEVESLFWQRFVKETVTSNRESTLYTHAVQKMGRFTPIEKKKIELCHGRLATALVTRLTPLYFDKSDAGKKLRLCIGKASSVQNSYMCLHFIANIAMCKGKQHYEEVLKAPLEGALALCESLHDGNLLIKGCQMDIFLHPRIWRMHVLKSLLTSQTHGKAKGAQDGMGKSKDVADPLIVPGFVTFSFLHEPAMLKEFGIRPADNHLPDIEPPSPGGSWSVRWLEREREKMA
eukprot:g3926.t1